MTQREPINLIVARQVMLFQHLDERQLQEICGLLKERRYRKGTIIFQKGDEGTYLFIVCKGRVRIYLTSDIEQGREATVRMYRPYDMFGEFAVLDGAPRSASAAALDDVTVLALHRDDFLRLLRENFDMVLHIFAMLTERVRYTTDYSEQLAFLNGPGRVAAALLQLASVEANGYGPVRLEITQQELAAFTNTTREWVNKILQEFVDQGLIGLKRGVVEVRDREGLRRRVG
jgi:CRP/FNR family transcriptional regulator/CRP/FNR family cyclic AMP-dependent transcriptional regulator